MIAEVNQVKRFLGIKFGYGEIILDGIYAIPTTTSKGNAFMRMEIKNGTPAGDSNYRLFWDEALAIDWYEMDKPDILEESKFSELFRKMELIRE